LYLDGENREEYREFPFWIFDYGKEPKAETIVNSRFLILVLQGK
jgi:hypothetical protein